MKPNLGDLLCVVGLAVAAFGLYQLAPWSVAVFGGVLLFYAGVRRS